MNEIIFTDKAKSRLERERRTFLFKKAVPLIAQWWTVEDKKEIYEGWKIAFVERSKDVIKDIVKTDGIEIVCYEKDRLKQNKVKLIIDYIDKEYTIEEIR